VAGPPIFRAWLERDPAPAYFLYGAGAGLAGLLALSWEKVFRAGGASVETLRWTASDLERESFAAVWRSPSFFARHRVFVLPDIAEMKKAHRDAIKAYLASPEPSALLVLHGTDYRQAQSFSRSANLLSAAPGEDAVVEALARYAVGNAEARGASLPEVSAEFLARWVGASFDALTVELDKVLAYSAGRGEVREEDIRAVCILRGGVSPFRLAEALVRKERTACLALLRRFAMTAEREEYHKLNGAVAWYLRDRVRGKGGGIGEKRAAELFRALSRIDREIKGESRLSPEQVYEIRLLSLLS
jgi:DNA polymerase III delta subunit